MRRIYIWTGLGLLVYLVLIWILGNTLGLVSRDVWVFRAGLGTLGILGAVGVLWWYRVNRPAGGTAQEPDLSGSDEIDVLLREAQAKLATAKLPAGARPANLPVIFLVGETGAAKTTSIVNSGLEPELLSGHVFQDNAVVSTRVANLWFARGSIFVEAGGKLLAEPARWSRLIARLRPGRLGVAVGKSEQAPRAAVVCFDIETFAQPGASEKTSAAARNLHDRLSEVSSVLGISLPVYVLFTKIDRIPSFLDYVRNLSSDEGTQVVGATLPLPVGRVAGVYAEEETARLSQAFDKLFRSFCDARPELLGRENDPAILPAVYEFPREFRKLRSSLVRFLVDLCRPSQLTVGPVLRGFYFSGVRPVVITQRAPEAIRRPDPVVEQAGSATGIFHPGLQKLQTPPPQAPIDTGSRRVPQWVFLSHLFNDVILQDRAARGASGWSTKTNVLRRVLLASGAALCVILAVGFLVSWLGNRALESQILETGRELSSGGAVGSNPPSLESLRRLDTLRQDLTLLSDYNRDGAPWRLRWGLYTGVDLEAQLRKLYFHHFHNLLFGQTQMTLLTRLKQLPQVPGPTDEYGPAYENLKAYLITTSNHDKSVRAFLAPVLVDRWNGSRNIDAESLRLAQLQFGFYSDELKLANPFLSENDTQAVEHARNYLSQFAGAERVYQNMLAEAGKNNPPIQFNKKFPGSEEAVIDTKEVAGAFTKGGWTFVKDAIAHADRYFNGEQWVLGDRGLGNLDRAKLEQQLRERFQSDFIGQWREFLKAASVVRYASIADASRKMNLLAGNQSPLLALLGMVSQNTAVDDPKVVSAFQPPQSFVPPGDRYVAPPNQSYMNSLVSLQTALEQIAGQPPPVNDLAATQTLAHAGVAKGAARQAAQAFLPDPEGQVDAISLKLLEAPITYVEALLRALGPAELNGKGRALCTQLRPLLNKYPFNPSASAQATLPEVTSVFRKPDGALWTFYDASVQKLLVRQGAQYVAMPGGGVTLNPAFVAFFNRAAAVTDALYPGASQEPRLVYTLKPAPSEGIHDLTLRLDGQTMTLAKASGAPSQFVWPGGGAHEAKATVQFGGADLGWYNNEGIWAVFQFFGEAEQWQPAGGGYQLEWVVRAGKSAMTLPNGKPLTVRFELNMGGLPPIFQKGFLSRIGCVAEVGR